jgi:hypothetical protein
VRATPESAFQPPTNYPRLPIYTWITTFDTNILPNADFRSYLGSVPELITVGDTARITFAIVAGDDLSKITANAFSASQRAVQFGWATGTIPFELTSFAANVNNQGDVILNRTTATELNNQLFEIERRSEEGQYLMIGYVNGHGTTTESKEYSYVDNIVETGTYFYLRHMNILMKLKLK